MNIDMKNLGKNVGVNMDKLARLIDDMPESPSITGPINEGQDNTAAIASIREVIAKLDLLENFRPEFAVAAIYDIRMILAAMESE